MKNSTLDLGLEKKTLFDNYYLLDLVLEKNIV